MSTQPTPFQISLVGVAYSEQRRVFNKLRIGGEMMQPKATTYDFINNKKSHTNA